MSILTILSRHYTKYPANWIRQEKGIKGAQMGKEKNKTGFTHRSRRNLMQPTKKEKDARINQWVVKTAGYTINRQNL